MVFHTCDNHSAFQRVSISSLSRGRGKRSTAGGQSDPTRAAIWRAAALDLVLGLRSGAGSLTPDQLSNDGVPADGQRDRQMPRLRMSKGEMATSFGAEERKIPEVWLCRFVRGQTSRAFTRALRNAF